LFNCAAAEIAFEPIKEPNSGQKVLIEDGQALFLLASNSNEDMALKILDMGFDLQKVYQYGEIENLISLVRNVVKNCYLRLFNRINDECPLKGALCTYMNDFATKQGKTVEPLVHLAIEKSSTEMLELLLDSGEDISRVDTRKRTALHIACKTGNSDIVERCLQQISVHVKCDRGRTPLHIATWEGHKHVVEMLLQNGADPAAKTNKNWTAVHHACRYACLECLKLLISQEESPLLWKTSSDLSVLHLAACNSKLDLFEFLIEKNLDPLDKTEDGYNALHYAAQEGREEIAKYLLKRFPELLTGKDNDKSTVLHHAAREGSWSTLRLLIDCGADLRATCKTKWTVLHEAARHCCLDCVKIILQKDASLIEEKTADGYSALHLAACNTRLEIVRFLMEKKLDPFERSRTGNTSLHLSAQDGQTKIVEFLLQLHPEKVNDRNDNNWTPLIFAARNGQCATLKFLIERGADLRISSKSNWTVLHYAARYCCLECVKLIVSKEAKLIELKTTKGLNVLHMAASNSNLETVQYLIELNINAKEKDLKGINALHYSSKEGRTEIVKYLLQNYPEMINETDSNGLTALHFSTTDRRCAPTKLLIELGADVTLKSKNNWTVLHQAARYCCLDCVQILIDKDESLLRTETSNGLNVLHLAACNSKLEMVKYFVDRDFSCLEKDEDGDNAFHLASQEGNLAAVKYFLQLHPEVINDKGAKKWTALHNAARNSQCPTLKFLIESDADLNAKDETGWTVLHFAARYCCLDCVKLIISKDESLLQEKDVDNDTALHLAACNLKEGIVKFLVEKGMDPQHKDDDVENALHKAAKYDNLENVKYLLELGVFQECDVKSAIKIASEKGHDSVVQELNKHLLKEEQ